MNKTQLRRLLLVGLVTLLALVTTMPAFAMAPTVETFHDEGTLSLDCGTFVATGPFAAHVRTTTFYDQAGNPIRLQTFVKAIGTLTNPLTGKSIPDKGSYNSVFDLQQGTETFVGLVVHVNVPSHSIVVLDAGKLVVDENGHIIFEGGPHQFLHQGEQIFCDALMDP